MASHSITKMNYWAKSGSRQRRGRCDRSHAAVDGATPRGERVTHMLQTELLRRWLADAYGAEISLVDVMERQLADLSGQHEMDAKFFEYLDTLQRHANMLQDCIADLEGETNALNKGGLPTFINTTPRQRREDIYWSGL